MEKLPFSGTALAVGRHSISERTRNTSRTFPNVSPRTPPVFSRRTRGRRQLSPEFPWNLTPTLILTQDEQSSVLRHLIEGGDLSQYGLINAVTRTAEDAKSYDRATELEMAGATVLDLKPTEWRDLALAA
jgi:hypothetical protein